MADIAVGSVERIFKAGLEIKKVVVTARRNKECRDIERSVARVGALLSLLNEMTETLKNPAISGPLEDLAESMEDALELIKDYDGRHPVRRLLGAGGMAKELCRVHDDILRKLTLGNFATTVHITITLTRSVRYGAPHPPCMQPQDAREVVNSYSSQLTTDDARSGINSEITLVMRETEVPYDTLSRLTEFISPGMGITRGHFTLENTSGGGDHSFVLKQKIVIRTETMLDRFRLAALEGAAASAGVDTMRLAAWQTKEVVMEGMGVDVAKLISVLHWTVGRTQLVEVDQVFGRRQLVAPRPWVPKMQIFGMVFVFLLFLRLLALN